MQQHQKKKELKKKKNKKKKTISKIGYTGSLLEGRGIELIINLAAILPEFEFHIAGGSSFEIKKIKNKSQSNIFFHGFLNQKKIEEFQSQMDILLAPYQLNTKIPGNKITTKWMSPLKIFEYMSSGNPFISSDIPVLKEVLTNNYNCLLCHPKKVNDWKKAILRIFNDKKLTKKIVENSLKDVSRKYTWKIRASKIVEIARKLV